MSDPPIDEPHTSWRRHALSMLVIYENPKDFPGQIVGRWHHIVQGGSRIENTPAFVVTDIDAARKLVPPGMYNLGRNPQDDPVIVEVWI